MRAAGLLLTFLAISQGCRAERLSVAVGLGGWDLWPFHRATASGGVEGLEADLMAALCASADLDCEPVALAGLEDRVALLANGTVDFVLATFSATPERAQQVRFVSPAYYSAGVALFSDSEAGQQLEQAIASGRGIPAGTRLCVRRGYFALEALQRDMPDVIIVEVADVADGAARAQAGECAALVDDSTAAQDVVGMPQLGVPVIYQQPYSVAIDKEAAGSELERRLVWALVKALAGGANSTMAQLEQRWVVADDIAPNQQLPGVGLAIDSFGIPQGVQPAWLRQKMTTSALAVDGPPGTAGGDSTGLGTRA